MNKYSEQCTSSYWTCSCTHSDVIDGNVAAWLAAISTATHGTQDDAAGCGGVKINGRFQPGIKTII